MTDETEIAATETRESKRARQIKANIADLLDDVVEAMEIARKEGFLVGFNIGQTPDQVYTVAQLEISKKW